MSCQGRVSIYLPSPSQRSHLFCFFSTWSWYFYWSCVVVFCHRIIVQLISGFRYGCQVSFRMLCLRKCSLHGYYYFVTASFQIWTVNLSRKYTYVYIYIRNIYVRERCIFLTVYTLVMQHMIHSLVELFSYQMNQTNNGKDKAVTLWSSLSLSKSSHERVCVCDTEILGMFHTSFCYFMLPML